MVGYNCLTPTHNNIITTECIDNMALYHGSGRAVFTTPNTYGFNKLDSHS